MTQPNLTSQVTQWIKIPTKLGHIFAPQKTAHIFLKNKTKPYVKAYKTQPTTKKPFLKPHHTNSLSLSPSYIYKTKKSGLDWNGLNSLSLTETLPSLSLTVTARREREREEQEEQNFLFPVLHAFHIIYICNSIICHIAIVKNGYTSPSIYVLIN